MITKQEDIAAFQERFEMYALGLTFTILGFAIQSADSGKHYYADLSEVLCWVALLVSGLVGLSRYEWIAVGFRYGARLSTPEGVSDATRLEIKRIERMTLHKYNVQRFTFVLGLVALVAGRGSVLILH